MLKGALVLSVEVNNFANLAMCPHLLDMVTSTLNSIPGTNKVGHQFEYFAIPNLKKESYFRC